MHHLLLLLLLITGIGLPAQTLRLNEAQNVNYLIEDEDGDTPDWFELYNPGPGRNLAGWSVTDDRERPGKWTFGNRDLGTDGYLLCWASDKNKPEGRILRTYLQRGNQARYVVPTREYDPFWRSVGYDDSNWAIGPTGIGYGDDDDATEIPTTARSVFLRQTFTLTEPAAISELILHMDFDDGFVAYINGREVARDHMGESSSAPPFDAFSLMYTEGRLSQGLVPNAYRITDMTGLLNEGENVLALQVHNISAESSDLTAIPYLTGITTSTSDGVTPPAEIDVTPPDPHTNFKISSEGETLYLFNPSGELVDSLLVAGIPPDVSIGIPPVGGSPVVFATPTPGARNAEVSYEGTISQRVTFSQPSGRSGPFALTLSGAPQGGSIHYTFDGSLPTENSPLYTGPLEIAATTALRARIFAPNLLPTPTQTRSYIINDEHDIPVVSLVTEPANFFDGQTGIYVLGDDYTGMDFPFFGSNIWLDREVPIHLSFLPEGNGETFSQDLGTSIFGGWSRARPQRSLSLFARKRYGDGDMDYAFFPNRPMEEYQSLVLRNSGNDWMISMLADVVMTGLMEGSGVDVQAARPVATYLNGEYWGFYNLREKINEHFLAGRYGLDPDEIDLLELWGQARNGSNVGYFEMLDIAVNSDLNVAANYEAVTERMDVDNFIKYQLAQIYYRNTDWPGNNIRFWRSQAPGGKWRWILYDTDFGGGYTGSSDYRHNTLAFALADDGPGWPNPSWSTQLLRGLLRSETFRHQFINQFADEMNSRFLPGRVNEAITDRVLVVAGEMIRARRRWGTPNNFTERVAIMRQFFNNRPAVMKGHIRRQFNLPAYHTVDVSISDPAEGYVELNSLILEEEIWSGDYFESVPIRLKAVPRSGYAFSHWELGSDATADEIRVNITQPVAFRPVFVTDPTSTRDQAGLAGLTRIRDVQMSPNPATEVARLQFTTLPGTRVLAQLFDAAGRLVHTFVDARTTPGAHSYELPVGDLTAGVYQLRLVENGARHGAAKWVIQ